MVVFLEMCDELLPTVKDFGALVDTTRVEGFMAPPGFDLIMLSIFVALPVVLRAKSFGARIIGAAIRAGVALFVFPRKCI